MGRIEKTVFISYRRDHGGVWARAIYQDLVANGYDAFFDFQSIDSGDFSRIILENIKARAHFLVLLAPSALERCEDPNDWLRREIETAIDYKRNIVPVMLESFDFGNPDAVKVLTGKLAILKKYNGLHIYSEYFEEGMARLRNRYLNIALDAVLHPVSRVVEQATKKQQLEANKAQPVKLKELTSNEWFEKGLNAIDLDERVRHYSEAIHLKPDDAVAYYNRGLARQIQGDLEGALQDYKDAIRFRPSLATARTSLVNILRKLDRNTEAKKHEQLASELIQKEDEYNRACFESVRGNVEIALEFLRFSLENRQISKEWARQDPDFENIHDDPRFKELVSE